MNSIFPAKSSSPCRASVNAQKRLNHQSCRSLAILVFGICALCASCQTYSPQVRDMWHKYLTVKPGMNRSQVHAVLPSTGLILLEDGREMESWHFAPEGFLRDKASMTVIFGLDGRVETVHRRRDHGHNCPLPHVLPAK